MIAIDHIKKIFFIGIGGIGMSALARYFLSKGKSVSGYDRTETTLTRQLTEEGIEVVYSDDVALAPKDADLVVYTPAVPSDHGQLVFYREHQYTMAKRSEVLGAITRSSFNICVAGTHGKTTISTMVAHLLRHSGYGCNAFLGGISANYGTNFWSSENETCVVEADEYDRSFLQLSPDIAIVTATDADHLDIYGTEENMRRAFVDFTEKIKTDGILITRNMVPIPEREGIQRIIYDIRERTDVYSDNIRPLDGGYLFDYHREGRRMKDVSLRMGGLHNIENMTAAMTVAGLLGIDEAAIREAVAEFRGVKRRFEYIVRREDLVYLDDYAHHPEELSALIDGAKGLFGGRTCTIIFQPHLFSRTRDLAEGFAAALDKADEVVLLPIYPAREKPMEGVTASVISDRMKKARVRLASRTEVLELIGRTVANGKKQLLITAGAGDIDTLVKPIQHLLTASHDHN